MQHTVYFGQRPFHLVTNPPIALPPSAIAGTQIDNSSIRHLLSRFYEPQVNEAYLVYPDMGEMLAAFKAQFEFIQAAGGLVATEQGSILMIFRKGKWDLPKGKLDPGEDLEQCAVREVEEETGLQSVTLVQPLHVTYHTYYQNGRQCLKESHWYLMEAPQQETLQPQTEEDIEQALWVPVNTVPQYLDNTHRSVADVLQRGLPLLRK